MPYINASIFLQLLSQVFPQLKELQREGGSQARLPMPKAVHDMSTHARPSACSWCQPVSTTSTRHAELMCLWRELALRALPCLQGRNRFKLFQQLAAFAFALVQAAGQELYLKSYVPEYSGQWFVVSLAILSGGAMVLVKVRPGLLQGDQLPGCSEASGQPAHACAAHCGERLAAWPLAEATVSCG